jgi:hypothetical protein
MGTLVFVLTNLRIKIFKNNNTLAAVTDRGSRAQSAIILKISTTSCYKQWAL